MIVYQPGFGGGIVSLGLVVIGALVVVVEEAPVHVPQVLAQFMCMNPGLRSQWPFLPQVSHSLLDVCKFTQVPVGDSVVVGTIGEVSPAYNEVIFSSTTCVSVCAFSLFNMQKKYFFT